MGTLWQSAPHLALFDISISNIDCRYIDTFEKYRYRQEDFGKYGYMDIEKEILENINIDIERRFWKISISISIRRFWKILISIRIWHIEQGYFQGAAAV